MIVRGSQTLPFSVNIPNAETREALQQAQDRENLIEYEGLDELRATHN